MNLETTLIRQEDLNYTLRDLTTQLEVVVNKIAGEKDKKGEIAKPERLTNGLLDTLYFLQEENKETLQYLGNVISRLAEVTWMPSMPEEIEYPVSNS